VDGRELEIAERADGCLDALSCSAFSNIQYQGRLSVSEQTEPFVTQMLGIVRLSIDKHSLAYVS